MAITDVTGTNKYITEIQGLSTDKKPTVYESGSMFFEVDTGKFYIYDKNNTSTASGTGWWEVV